MDLEDLTIKWQTNITAGALSLSSRIAAGKSGVYLVTTSEVARFRE